MMFTKTIRLHRVICATPPKIYWAFLDADAKAKWLPPNGFTGKVHHLEAKVGGTFKCCSPIHYRRESFLWRRLAISAGKNRSSS